MGSKSTPYEINKNYPSLPVLTGKTETQIFGQTETQIITDDVKYFALNSIYKVAK